MRLGNAFASANFQCGASAADAAEFACADFDFLRRGPITVTNVLRDGRLAAVIGGVNYLF